MKKDAAKQPLSARLRPDVECAPWVVDAVVALELRLDEALADVRGLEAERDASEHEAGTYYEGPDAPERFAEYVRYFAATNPGATVDAWAAYATRLAQRAYREGYTRGKEWRERDIDALGGVELAEAFAEDERDHGWAWTAPQIPTSEELAAKVEGDLLDELPNDEARARYLDELGRLTGMFRIVVSR